MILRVFPGKLTGDTVWAPPGKSVMQRMIAVAMMAQGRTMIRRPSECDDCTNALLMAAQLGAEIELGDDAVAIHGNFPLTPRTDTLTPGESGLGLRMFGVLSSLHDAPLAFQREGTLLNRDMSDLAATLKSFGVTVQGTAPGDSLQIEGPLQGGHVSIDSGGSSQVLTGLLCALAHAQSDSELKVENVVSRPYLQMTLEVLEDMGIVVEVLEHESRDIRIRIPGEQRATAMDSAVDGDWSAAAFLMALGLLCAPHHLNVEGLDNAYTQADVSIKGI